MERKQQAEQITDLRDKMTKELLLDKLNRATDRAATLAIGRSMPVTISKKGTIVGYLLVEKNKNGLYDVLSIDKRVIYSDVLVFDIAVILAQRHTDADFGTVKKILHLEETYSKYHNDMVHYLHCLKLAKKNHDIDRMAILEDKFQIAESKAKNIRDNITIFKRVK